MLIISLISLIISLTLSLLLLSYYFNNIEYNSYLKNVTIYALYSFVTDIISQTTSGNFTIMSSLITSILVGLIYVKIMEFAKKQTNSFIGFVILCFVLNFILVFILSGILTIFAF